MTFKPRFFYESGTANEGGGNPTDTLEEIKTGEQTAAPADIPHPSISDDEIKNYGFDSPDALKTFLADRKNKEHENSITPEQKKEQENIEKANLLKFAAENKLLTVEDYTEYETLKTVSDKDLVFQNFKKEFAVDNPEITDPQELEEAAQEEFTYINKLNDPKGLEKAEKRWQKEAKELRSPVESKVIAAQEQFKQNNNLRETYPKFENFVTESIKRNTPDKLAIIKVKNGAQEIPIEIEVTEKDREEMGKAFKTPKTFTRFTTAKPEEITKDLDAKMNGWLFQHKKDEIASKIFDAGKGVGTLNGSNVGANNPFPLARQTAAATNTGEETLEQSNARIAKARREAQQTR